ncbi:D-alanyl-D-alanine carboxypeptidase (penicillin-binding protein 5/6) [Conyzicola lurida]|uniref:D-alanyl-D-alanine carboxypeptidase (Penicillin-binding protein 5/6) n=1 Tax=Conyzicola lurida TaxID=1172621 RepID=A0A841AMY2_9MICO|nr:D-alanyl-D-alanine carboxypeptidase [Conyzicola lurida]MBB5843111.1 D-alanyl-D-alanine carboxypeptidase (penicillin-binding protein 5/6) [Conyzicola lurida]
MALTRRQILRRRRVAVFGAAAVLIGTVFYLPMTLLAPLGSVAAEIEPYSVGAQPAADLGWPALGASAVGAIGYDGVLGAGGNDQAAPIASITKIISALVVLEAKPIGLDDAGPDIEFTAKDVAIRAAYQAVNGATEPVQAGMVLTQRQVMDVMLVESANNYAESLVTWAFGSVDEFLPVANAWLADHGLASTSISDPTGMSPLNVSTASDLVQLGKLALANPVVNAIVGTATEQVPVLGEISNSNALLGIDGIRGIKTGTLDEAGACLLFAADYVVGGETVTIVGVVLGGTDHKSLNVSVRALLADVEAGFHEVQLTSAGQEFGTYSTPWGDDSPLVAAATTSVVVWADTPVTSAIETDEVGVAKKGADVGDVTFTVGDERIVVPLELASTIDDPGAFWRLTNPAALF